MATLEDLESRVGRLERAVIDCRNDSAAARVLAGAADRDVSEFRQEFKAHTKVLNSLRETQVEQGKTLGEHSKTLGEHTKILGEHSRILGEHSKTLGEHTKILGEHTKILGEHTKRLDELDRKMSDGFSTMNVGMAQIVALLRNIENN